MNRMEFNKENLDIIKRMMSSDTSQQSKYDKLETLGFKLFDGALGKIQKDCLYVHENKKDNTVKVQLETGFGRSNYARYVYFNS